MENMISNLSEKQEFTQLINQLKETIFTPSMVDIFELTFAYDIKNSIYFNRTLFTDFAGLSAKNTKEELFTITNQLLYLKKTAIQNAKNTIIQSYQIEGKVDILLGTLNYIEKIIDLTILGLPFEVEKAGYTLDLKPEEIVKRVQQMETIEKELFGGNIGENPLEVVNCYRKLKTKIEKKLPIMTEDQKKICENLLHTIKELPVYVDIDGIFKNREKDNRSINYKKIFEENKIMFDKKINRADYIKIFELIFSMYGIHKPVKVDERNSIYDGDDGLHIPKNSSYDTLSVQKILILIQHEIEKHMLSLENNEKNIGGFRGANNLFMEEGGAMILEGVLQGKSLSEYNGVSTSLPNLLAGELLNGDEYKEFLAIFSKKDIDRKKRLYPLHDKGIQHKDTVYTRGPKATIAYITKGGDPKDTYIGRLQDKDIVKVIEKKDIKYPKLISEVIIQKLINGKIEDQEFKNYITGKYNFLSEKDIHNEMNNFTTDQKRKLIEILQIIKQ